MVVIIVFLSVIASMYSNWLKHKRKGGEGPADDKRLASLVTDSGYDLRRQFRDLERDA